MKAVRNEFSTSNNCSRGVRVTVTPNGIRPTNTPTPTPTPASNDVEAPRRPSVSTYWTDKFTGIGYVEAEIGRVADGEDYYNYYYVTRTCISGRCTSRTSSVSTIQDDIDNHDDCARSSGDECFQTREISVSFSALSAGDSVRVTYYARACKNEGRTCSSYGSDSVTHTEAPLLPAPSSLSPNPPKG